MSATESVEAQFLKKDPELWQFKRQLTEMGAKGSIKTSGVCRRKPAVSPVDEGEETCQAVTFA